jgi:hypothetical protein
VTLMPPGFTVRVVRPGSCVPAGILTVTVTLAPAASEPLVTVSLGLNKAAGRVTTSGVGTLMLNVTGPPTAVRVNVADVGARVIVVVGGDPEGAGNTDSVPGAGGGVVGGGVVGGAVVGGAVVGGGGAGLVERGGGGGTMGAGGGGCTAGTGAVRAGAGKPGVGVGDGECDVAGGDVEGVTARAPDPVVPGAAGVPAAAGDAPCVTKFAKSTPPPPSRAKAATTATAASA